MMRIRKISVSKARCIAVYTELKKLYVCVIMSTRIIKFKHV